MVDIVSTRVAPRPESFAVEVGGAAVRVLMCSSIAMRPILQISSARPYSRDWDDTTKGRLAYYCG
jgi:hypothetical protein